MDYLCNPISRLGTGIAGKILFLFLPFVFTKFVHSELFEDLGFPNISILRQLHAIFTDSSDSAHETLSELIKMTYFGVR